MVLNILAQKRRGLRGIPFLILLAFTLPVFAADEPPVPEKNEGPTLEQLLRNTLDRNGQIKESLQDVEGARAQLDLAKSAWYPKGSVVVLAAPIFEERGDALHSKSNWGKWGPFFREGGEVVQPLHSFGMISSYRKAAENQILAKDGLADVKRNEVVYSTKEFYYGYLLASALEDLVGDLISTLDEAVEKAESGLSKGKGGVKSHDVYRLKTALEDLKQKKLLAKQSRQTAERAVSWMSVTEFENLRKRPLDKETLEPKTLDEYLALAKNSRPEFRALKSGQEARAALRDAKRAQSYPILFVGAYIQYSWTPVRDKQDSAFAYDPFNSLMGGGGIGLKLDLDFGKHAAEAAEQQAELLKLKATESYAAPGIELQVKRAYWEYEQARDGLEIAIKRKAVANKWFVSSAIGWSIGITPAKDLLESLEGDGLGKRNYLETVYSYNVALAKLTQAVGIEVTNLKYR